MVVLDATTANGTHVSTTPDTEASCAPTAGAHSLIGSVLTVVDMLDTARSRGFVEFQMIAEPGVGDTSITAGLSANEFAGISDGATVGTAGFLFKDCFESGDLSRWSRFDG